MRLLTVRLTISLIVGITLISLLSSYYEVRLQKQGLRRDLERRAEVLGETLADKVEPFLKKGSHKELQVMVDRFGDREHLAGVAVYNAQGGSIAITPGLAPRLTGEPTAVQQAVTKGQNAAEFIRLGEAPVYIYAVPSVRMKRLWAGWRSFTTPATLTLKAGGFGARRFSACSSWYS